jgi:uncharacterized protein (TIRG00374 family)
MESSEPITRNEGTPPPKPARRLLFGLLRWAIGVGLLVYLVESKTIDLRTLSKLWTAWPTTVLALFLILLDMALIAYRLCVMFRPRGIHLGLWTSFQLTLIGLFFSTFLPGRAGGDLARAYYALRDNRGRREEILTILIFDRMIGFFSFLLIPLLFVLVSPSVLWVVPALRILITVIAGLSVAILLVFLACLLSRPRSSPSSEETQRMGWARKTIVKVLHTIREYRRNPGTILAALGISLVANSLVVVVTALAVHLLNPSQVSARMWVIIPAGQIANSLPLTPGGLGVGETAFSALFDMAGMRGGADALLCWRIWTILASLLGLAFYWGGLKEKIFKDRPSGGVNSESGNPVQSGGDSHD